MKNPEPHLAKTADHPAGGVGETDEPAAQRALVAEYIDHHEKVQKATRAMFDAIEAMRTRTDEAREHGRLAGRLASRLGFPSDERGVPLGRQLGYLKSALDGVLSGQPRLVNSARGVVMADWRETPNGRRALALQAALGEGLEGDGGEG